MNPITRYHAQTRPAPTPEPKPPSGLEALGNVIDVPGSMVRDVLSLKNPFDQVLSPTRSENRTTGRDLLRQYNLVDPTKNTWGNALAGVAVEVALDPTTYLGFGALTHAGKAASKAGLVKNIDSMTDAVTKTPKHLIDSADDVAAATKAWTTAGGTDDLLHKPLKALISFAPPKTPALELAGKAAVPAAKAIDAIGSKVMDIPAMRTLRAAFDPRVLNTVTRTGQEIAEHRNQVVKDQLASLGKDWAPLVDTPDPIKSASIVDNSRTLAADAGLDNSKLGGDSASLSGAEHFTKAAGMAHAATDLLGRTARADGLGVPLDEALKRLGMDTPRARENLAHHLGADLSKHSIDEHLLRDAERMVKPFTDPEVVGAARKALEKFNAIYKSNLTVPFPAFHARNLLSGQIQNIVRGFADETQKKGPMQFVRPLIDGLKMSTGKTVKGLSKVDEFKSLGLSDAEATQMLKHEAFAYGLLGDSTVMGDLGAHTSRMPGGPILSSAPRGTTWAQFANPLLVAGGLSEQTKFAPARIGGDIAGFTESLNRLSPYIALRKSGFAPEEAARRVMNAQVDYSDVTQWETKYGKLAIPFYQFSKGMLASTLDELMHHPGGRTAVSIKANARGSQDNQKPHWLRNQTSVPLENGKTLAAGGLMTDGVATLLGLAAQADARGVAADIANRLNPLIKHPIEMATGQSLFHQRPLSTVTPEIGGTIQNIRELAGSEKQKTLPFISLGVEHAAKNSPFNRYLSTARRLSKKEPRFLDLVANASGVTLD